MSSIGEPSMWDRVVLAVFVILTAGLLVYVLTVLAEAAR